MRLIQTLWDLVDLSRRDPGARERLVEIVAPGGVEDGVVPGCEEGRPGGLAIDASPPRVIIGAGEPMRVRYQRVAKEMLARYDVRVRKWRSSMTGVAWCVEYEDGRVSRLIESPRPRGPMSVAVFLHEIGHHAIGLGAVRPRCLEELRAWEWSLSAMEANGLNITDPVRRRVHLSLWYAVSKARRRGLRELPVELEPFADRSRIVRIRSAATR